MGGYEAEILITDPGQCKTGTDPHVDDAGTDNNYEDEQKHNCRQDNGLRTVGL